MTDIKNASTQSNLQTYFRLFLMAVVLAIPFLLQVLARILGYAFQFPPLVQIILATLVQFGCGWIIYKEALQGLMRFKANLPFLIILGTTIAYAFSLAAYSFNLRLPLYFETSAFILTLVLFGKWLEAYNKDRSMPFMNFVEKEEYFKIRLNQQTDQTSASYLPFVIGISLLTLAGWGWFANNMEAGWIHAAAVFIAACPAAAGMAVPIVIYVARGLGDQYNLFSEDADEIDRAHLAHVTTTKIRQSLFLAFALNALTIPIAIAGLFNPDIAAGTIAMSSIAVMANAFLLAYWKPSLEDAA